MIWGIGQLDVSALQEQLDKAPHLWNRHRERTEMYGTPHNGVSDIWARYRPWSEYTGDWARFHDEHVSVWYPGIADIPAAWSLSRKVQRMLGAETLGGVLITMVPPGGKVDWHVDGGWHAGHYRKVGVQIRGDQNQRFAFEGSELRADDGDVYEFQNDVPHAVFNDSDRVRQTMIVCVR